jgi:hypothetical protein
MGHSARFIRPGSAMDQVFQDYRTLPSQLMIDATRWVAIGANGRWFDLEGRNRGRQGVRMSQGLEGAYHLPFEDLITESAYQMGATYERSNITKRVIDMGVIIGGKHSPTSHAYRMAENNWWDAWPHDEFGWLGCHTMLGGWRWARVKLAEKVNTSMKQDPTAHNNKVLVHNLKFLAPKPWWAKRTVTESWTPHIETIIANGVDEETITLANRGNLPSPPLFLVQGPGTAWIQDGMTSRMVELPVLSADDGYILVDTDPGNRTITGSKDPVDNIFYDFIRSSRLLDFFLHDVAALGLPVWRRKYVEFNSMIPAKTVANIKVRHNNPNGSITAFLPQRYSRPS